MITSPKAIFVYCSEINEEKRIGCVMYPTIDYPFTEPLSILIPIDVDPAFISEVTVTISGVRLSIPFDEYSKASARVPR